MKFAFFEDCRDVEQAFLVFLYSLRHTDQSRVSVTAMRAEYHHSLDWVGTH